MIPHECRTRPPQYDPKPNPPLGGAGSRSAGFLVHCQTRACCAGGLPESRLCGFWDTAAVRPAYAGAQSRSVHSTGGGASSFPRLYAGNRRRQRLYGGFTCAAPLAALAVLAATARLASVAVRTSRSKQEHRRINQTCSELTNSHASPRATGIVPETLPWPYLSRSEIIKRCTPSV